MLLSIFGANRAFRSLSGSNSEDRIESDRTASERVDTFTDNNEGDRIASQPNASSSNARTLTEDGELVLTPLQVAGTFIQRQKRIEEDPTVRGTEVAVIAVADGAAPENSPTAAQPTTITNDQTYTPPTSTNPTSPRPTNTTPSTEPAVPALW